jgi:hypothetical protein
MKKLTKAHIIERNLIAEALAEKAEVVKQMCDKVDVAITNANAAIAEYNMELSGAREWRDSIVEQAEEWREGRSEKWLEGEAASEHENWLSEYRDADLDDLDEIEDPDYPEIDEVLNSLSEACE